MTQPARTIGQLAQLACTWEVLARKAGNVCPGREFPDLTVDDFLKSAAAIAPVLDEAPHQPLGVTILHAIEATRAVVRTNANLGIVLLLAPLASVPLDEPLAEGLQRVLDNTTVEDARNAYAAIRLANPGGLGEVKEQDVRSEPTKTLREVMALARNQDLIAAQYVGPGFLTVAWIASELRLLSQSLTSVEECIVLMQWATLRQYADSLISRKLGSAEAELVTERTRNTPSPNIVEGRQAYRALDVWLRSDNHARNPGTTADLIAAALFVALREGWISPDMTFEWKEHPFAKSE